MATLLAFAHTFLSTVHDDALDLFDALMRTAFSAATREGQQERLRTIHDLDAAARVLSEACQVVLDETQDPTTLLERIYVRVPVEHLRAAVTTVGELTRPPDDTYAQELLGCHLMMRRFLPTFWRTSTLSPHRVGGRHWKPSSFCNALRRDDPEYRWEPLHVR